MKSPHLDPEWLRQKYAVEGLSTYEIGALVGRDSKRIHEKLRDFGIPTRPRGHNLSKSGRDNHLLNGGRHPSLGRRWSEDERRNLSIKASVPKPWLRGPRNGMAGRTGTSNPNYRSGSSPERQRLYASGEWRTILRTVYKRDNYQCVRCGAPKTTPRSLHAHHPKSWAEHPDLRFDMSNLVTLCRPCHHWVHSKANTAREHLG